MLNLEIDQSDCDFITKAGREPAICELRCANCGDGLRFDQKQCATCGDPNPRFIDIFDFNPRLAKASKSIP